MSRYGCRIAHLDAALAAASKALLAAAACTSNNHAVDLSKASSGRHQFHDVLTKCLPFQSFMCEIQDDLQQANLENQVIYYAEIPANPPLLEECLAVNGDVPIGLQNPQQIIGERRRLFGNIVGIGVQKAIGMTVYAFVIQRIILNVNADHYNQIKSRLVRLDVMKGAEEMQKTVRM
jgi:hypothetical protein